MALSPITGCTLAVVVRATLSSRLLLAAALPTVATLFVACGSGKAKATSGSCGPDYVFIAGGHRHQPPNCGGTLPPPVTESVAVGKPFSIVIASNVGGDSLVYPVPMPGRNAPVRFVRRTGDRADYLAEHRGVALLWARHTRLCPKLNPKLGSCVIYRVSVVGRTP